LPPFEDYAMKGRTYRYFEGQPLYPFGYGLSYTTFSYRGLTLQQNPIKVGDPLTLEVTVTNTGKREGDEVAQLYLNFPKVPGAPLSALRGFTRSSSETRRIEEGAFRIARTRSGDGERCR
jgi:beta-glucosidase